MTVKVAVCVPSTGQTRAGFARCYGRFMSTLGTTQIFPEDSDQVTRDLWIEGSGVSSAREQLVSQALDWGATHIVFLDEDMGFHHMTPIMMMRRRLPLVACNYPFRMAPMGRFTATKINSNERMPTTEQTTGLEECRFAGFGLSVITREVFDAVPKPRFLAEWNEEHQYHTTEDVPFYRKVQEAGFKTYVDHDASKTVAHLGTWDYDWTQPVFPEPEEPKEEDNVKPISGASAA